MVVGIVALKALRTGSLPRITWVWLSFALCISILSFPSMAESTTSQPSMAQKLVAKQLVVEPQQIKIKTKNAIESSNQENIKKEEKPVAQDSDLKASGTEQSELTESDEKRESSYKLGTGEVISIIAFDEPDLAVKGILIGRTGSINFPLIGKIQVADKRVGELESEIETLLKDGYLKKPKITVKIEKYRDFYVNGAVKQPGAYTYTPGLTIRKAIAICGGLTDRASMRKIGLKKEYGAGELQVSNIDRTMGPGDVLTIGESLF